MFASVYARDRQLYSASVTSTNPPDHGESVRASRAWWDAEAVDYHHEHGEFLGAHSPDGEFVWCPEGLHEGDWALLGDVAGRDVLEIGCGSAPCSRWIAGRGARAVAVDLSAGMLRV
ncbi:class I SAM-dependent methyltransferase, partial [Dietzia sp. DQ12-76]|nr:class I SAM-dependent methyltransferase [Dietzia sp. DQ12-76]